MGDSAPYSTLLPRTPPQSPPSGTASLPISPKPSDDLSLRLRQLARSVGPEAVHDLIVDLPPSPSVTPTLSPSRSASTSPSLRHAPTSPSAAFGPRSLSTSAPDGFYLEEIREEGQEDGANARARVPSAEGVVFTDESDGSESEQYKVRGRKGRGRVGGLGLFNTGGEPLKKQSSRVDRGQSLLQAVQQGLTNLAVEVRLVDGELLVESSQPVIAIGSTLSELCLDPLFEHFESQQPTSGSRRGSMSASRLPFQLIITLASSPSMTFQYLLHALTRLNDASYLTSYCPKADFTTNGLLSVTCVGPDTPLDDIRSLTPRYVFAQAPIGQLTGEDWTKELSPLAGGGLKEATGWDGTCPASEEQMNIIKEQVELAHSRKMRAHYSDLPRWPVHTREMVQETLKKLGVDYI